MNWLGIISLLVSIATFAYTDYQRRLNQRENHYRESKFRVVQMRLSRLDKDQELLHKYHGHVALSQGSLWGDGTQPTSAPEKKIFELVDEADQAMRIEAGEVDLVVEDLRDMARLDVTFISRYLKELDLKIDVWHSQFKRLRTATQYFQDRILEDGYHIEEDKGGCSQYFWNELLESTPGYYETTSYFLDVCHKLRTECINEYIKLQE